MKIGLAVLMFVFGVYFFIPALSYALVIGGGFLIGGGLMLRSRVKHGPKFLAGSDTSKQLPSRF